MAHDHFIMVPMTGQGAYTDPSMSQTLTAVMSSPFNFSDIFLYAHGWWTTAQKAMSDYTTFSVGLAGVVLGTPTPPAAALGVGIHWPSMISEDQNSILDIFEPLSYFNRAMMADHVGEEGGYATLRLLLGNRTGAGLALPRLHLIGHSFGCKIVCSTLQEMQTQSPDLLASLRINLVLLQAAFQFNELDAGQSYGAVADIPNIRILVTRSDLDKALSEAFVAAGALKLFSPTKRALGDEGPSDLLKARLGGSQAVSVDLGFTPGAGLDARLVVADLTPLHQNDDYKPDPFSGHHSDIFRPEIYRLIAAFLAL